MTSHNSITYFLDYIDSHLSNNYIMKGGNESTQPYKSYESLLNNMYEYIRFVFVNNKNNHKEFSKSIEELDHCKKYKNEICGKEEDDDDISRTFIPIEEPETEIKPTVGVLLRKGEELE